MPPTTFLFLLDGLEEVPADRYRLVVEAINDFVAPYHDHRYLVTCRVHAYVGQQHQLARFPVTAVQFRAFVSASGMVPGDKDALSGILNHPASLVWWHAAMAFCRWLTAVFPESLVGYEVRLPTEAE